MSRKIKKTSKKSFQSGSKKSERYIQPSILMALKYKPSYGYELIKDISQFGFVEGQAPPGMIYRHLRDMEDNGLVSSEWETEGTGPAKRVYQLTMEGSEVLDYWIGYMKKQAQRLQGFIEQYENIKKDKGSH
jgi:PadR family transcriptional regulator, regulatory protein PadR